MTKNSNAVEKKISKSKSKTKKTKTKSTKREKSVIQIIPMNCHQLAFTIRSFAASRTVAITK